MSYNFSVLHCCVPCVFVAVACTGECTIGPTVGSCAGPEGAEVAGVRVVADSGERVGYLRVAEPAALPALEAVLPMCAIGV
jgi:hypothetical protein